MLKQVSLHHLGVFLLFCVAAFLRTYQIEEYPLSINQDELNNIYDGWSFAETGQDRWQTPNPFVLKGLGNNDYRQSTEAWLCAIVFKVFGFSVAAGRYLSSFLGLLSLWLLYLFCKRVADRRFGLVALIFAIFSPYHVQMSRMAHEGAILPAVCMLGVMNLWLSAMQHQYRYKYAFFLGLLIGLSANTYRSMYVIAPLMLLPVLLDMLRGRQKPQTFLLFLLAAFLGALPQLYSILTLPKQVLERAGNVVLKPQGPFEYLGILFSNFYDNLEPLFLFFQYGRFNNLTVMRDLPFVVIPFYLGILCLIFKKNTLKGFHHFQLLALLLIAVLPAAISLHNPHALRASVLCILIPLVAAVGFRQLMTIYRQQSPVWLVLLLCLNIGFFAFYAEKYTGNDILRNNAHQHELVKMSRRLAMFQKDYDSVYFDNSGNSPYLYVMAFSRITPSEFHKATKKYSSGIWIDFQQINKFRFMKSADLKQQFYRDTSRRHLYVSYEPLAQPIDSIGNLYNKTRFTVSGR